VNECLDGICKIFPLIPYLIWGMLLYMYMLYGTVYAMNVTIKEKYLNCLCFRIGVDGHCYSRARKLSRRHLHLKLM